MTDLIAVRYPSGATEFRMSDKAPEVGDVLKRNGDTWVVEEVDETPRGTQVTLRPLVKLPEPDTDADEPE